MARPPLFQVRIDVTVSGTIFSSDGLLYAHSALSENMAEGRFLDYEVPPTFAIYTAVHHVSLSHSVPVRYTMSERDLHPDVVVVALEAVRASGFSHS